MDFRTRIDPEWQKNLPRDPREFGPNGPPGATLDDRLLIVDRLLEPQTIAHFLEFAISGELPTNGTTSLPLLSIETFQQYVMVPYAQWAPGPHDQFSSSPLDHALTRIGSKQDPSRLVVVEKGVHAMKSRIWEGIMPLSDNRWKQKHLDEPEYHHLACRYIGLVIEVFAYFQLPPILEGITTTYTLIFDHFRDFDRVFNALPSRRNQPPTQLANLWEAYITALYTCITTRAHSWVIAKAERLRTRDYGLLSSLPYNPGGDYNEHQLEIMNRIQDSTELAARADYTIFMHLPSSDPPCTGSLPTQEQRRVQYAQALRLRSRQKMMGEMIAHAQEPENSPARLLNVCRYQREAQNEIRQELRKTPVKLPPVGWVHSLKQKMEREEERVEEGVEEKRWGFVAYRLTYGQTQEEWEEFMRKLDSDLKDWGDGLDGANDIKDFASLQWFDGRELHIAEGDFDAAKKHFASLIESNTGNDTTDPWYSSDVFLAIDSHSVSSYIHGSPFSSILCAGDTGGFVTVIDVSFDPEDPGEHAEEHPHYGGHLRILPSLIYCDLFAMMAAQTQFPEDMWPLAMWHPEQIYIGPTVGVQEGLWRQAREVRDRLLEFLVKRFGEEGASH